MSSATLTQLRSLSTAEKLQLVEDLWDMICERDEDIGLTPAQQVELDRRLDECAATPREGVTLAELKATLRK